MVKEPKHCSKPSDSISTIFIDPCEGNSGLRSLFELYSESQDRFLTHWLVIKSIVFLIETIRSNIFRCNYLRNKKYFLFFFCLLEIDIQFSTFSKKRWPSKLMYFWPDGIRKTWLDKCLKVLVSEEPWTINVVNGVKHCSKLNNRTFTIFIDPS